MTSYCGVRSDFGVQHTFLSAGSQAIVVLGLG